ncbi:hypothetical protein CYMTET_8654 [Cymbomonas tetramitiformis]|uniref:Uncharacterized protein n=1 Tax=Cymbomonas tetramitiformis TaxID=36881 RepID=A0AAE0GT71_9CHLO|nr:hypothetical protein CYMTET_8654 [Cymbomonas tetramitiformis]
MQDTTDQVSELVQASESFPTEHVDGSAPHSKEVETCSALKKKLTKLQESLREANAEMAGMQEELEEVFIGRALNKHLNKQARKLPL